MTTKKKGRPFKRIKEIKRTHRLRNTTDLSIRAISKVILDRDDPKTIWRWLQLDPETL